MAIASFVSRAHSRERVQINSQGRHWFDFRRSCVGRATGEMKEPDCGPVPQPARAGDRRGQALQIGQVRLPLPKQEMPCPMRRAFCHGRSRMATRTVEVKRGSPINRAIREPSLKDCDPGPRQPGSVRSEGLQRASDVTGTPPVPWACNCVRATRIGFLAKRVPAAQRATRRILRATGPGSTAFRRGVQKAARLAVPLCGKPFSCGRRGG